MRPQSIPVFAAALLTLSLHAFSEPRPRLDLNGTWDFYPDAGERTLANQPNQPGKIMVPGAWQAQGYGEPGGTIPSANIGPGTSPADYLRHNLMARCLYVRSVSIPSDWQGRRVVLCVRRAYRYTDVTVNDRPVGSYEGFSTPFEFDITTSVKFGETNRLVLGVDNRPRPGRDTLGTGNLYGNWGGIGGPVYLEARPEWDADVFAMPQIAQSRVVLRVTLTAPRVPFPRFDIYAEIAPWHSDGKAGPIAGRATRATPPWVSVPDSASGRVTVDIPVAISEPRLWTPEDPALYVARVRLSSIGPVADEVQVRFGMREISADGRNLFLNGKPLYLSGYGDDATEPLTGMLPANKAVYLKRLRLMRSLGFNFVRHHSCVPHDEYFEAADETGMLVQPEAGLAYTGFWRTGSELFAREWPNIVRSFRNHPSIWAWCMGNELFLNELPDRPKNDADNGADLAKPIRSGPLATVADHENGLFGPPGKLPTNSFKQSNYFRDVEVSVNGHAHTILGARRTTRVFTDGPHELGLKFISEAEGQLSKIRYFRVAEEIGTHVGHLWDHERGTELARVEFTNETASGWQEAALPGPVPISGGRIYIVSVNANSAYAAVNAAEGQGVSRQDVLALLKTAYRQAKELDPTRLVHASDGGTPHAFTDVLSNGGPERSRKPYLMHEYGTYCCSLPDFSLIPRLSGVIRPLTYERADSYVQANGLTDVYPRLRESSLAMRADAQKFYIEAAKASGLNAGFSFWLGVDFPDSPEGCWDEGVLNQLWEPKPHLTNDLPNLNGPTVLLTTVGLEQRSFDASAGKAAGIRLWHYGAQPISDARLTWNVTESDRVLQHGERSGIACAPGEVRPVAGIRIDPLAAPAPKFLKLELELWQRGHQIARNAWEFFAYPATATTAKPGVYSEAGPIPGATELKSNDDIPSDLRVLITKGLKRERHQALLRRGRVAVLVVGNGGFKEARAGYFLNQYGTGFGGIIEDHPAFAGIPHQGRLTLGLYQLIAGGGLLETETMPAALREGSIVWGLRLTGWISPVKNLRKVAHVCEASADNGLRLVLCNLDLLADRPESHYVLNQMIEYLASGRVSALAKNCAASDLESLLQ